MKVVTLPPGTYWIGDPCYVLGDKNGYKWGVLLERTGCLGIHPLNKMETKNDRTDQTLRFELKEGHDAVTFPTLYGDGSYPCSLFEEVLSVDSGTLSCVPVVALPDDYVGKEDGIEHTFDDPQPCWFAPDGTIHIGSVTIWTGALVDDED